MAASEGDWSGPTRESHLFGHASRGDEAALSGLIETYLPRLRGYVRVHIGEDLRRRESADDIVQSVCRELVERETCLRFPCEEAFRAWLFTAALSKVREKGRFHRREKRDVGREAAAAGSEADDRLLAQAYASAYSPSRQAMAREHVDRFEHALASLDDDHRQVIALAKIADLPLAAVAEAMGRSEGAVRKLLGRALLKLSNQLEDRER
jgi:RNA polymerase sigma-70 factor (ECF subfamily)